MKLGGYLLLFVFLSILAIGCDKTNQSSASGPQGEGKAFTPQKKGLPKPPPDR
jgi:hypothetical protein